MARSCSLTRNGSVASRHALQAPEEVEAAQAGPLEDADPPAWSVSKSRSVKPRASSVGSVEAATAATESRRSLMFR